MKRLHNNADREILTDLSYVLLTYKSLLADVSQKLGVALCAPDNMTYDWVSIEAPKLDKILLRYLEGDGEMPTFPDWLTPIWELFVSEMNPNILKEIRQVLLFCYKIEIEPTNEQLQEAQASFESTEQGVRLWSSCNKTAYYSPMLYSARKIVGLVLYKINWSEIKPKHGPGAVYPPRRPSVKSRFRVVYPTIDRKYPFCDWFCGLPSFWHSEGLDQEDVHSVTAPIETLLTAVPKDSRGPRLICVHPSEAIWIQQGCRSLLERAIEHSPVTSGRINFRDQSVNGKLALASSADREYVTLDLKEASDRISCSLVRFLFGDHAYDYMSCARASHAKLMDGRVIELEKWAPMGNCLTFPVQSLLFFSIVRSGILCRYGIDCSDVYVFGDDIMFPSRFYDGAISALVSVGLVPNLNKTFRHGFFRESCGVDAYRGKDVTPLRMKETACFTVSGAMSISSLAKRLRISGYRLASQSLYTQLRKYHKLFLSNNPDTQGIYEYDDCSFRTLLMYGRVRYNEHLHIFESPVTLVKGLNDETFIDSWWNLQDSLLSITNNGYASDRGGLEYTVPHRERLQRGWAEVRLT